MECLEHRKHVANTVTKVRQFSFKEKKNPHFSNDEIINQFLDTIIEMKRLLISKTEKIDEINQLIEECTWIDGHVDDDFLMIVNDLISALRDLRSTLVREFVLLSVVKRRNIAVKEINKFKQSIDDLKESYEDLESVFFYLPRMSDFNETTKLLSVL